jgi:hypothetical protein
MCNRFSDGSVVLQPSSFVRGYDQNTYYLVFSDVSDADFHLKTAGVWKVALQNVTGQKTSAIFSRMDREAVQHDNTYMRNVWKGQDIGTV